MIALAIITKASNIVIFIEIPSKQNHFTVEND